MNNKRLAIRRVLILLVLYCFGLTLSGYLAFLLRFDFDINNQFSEFSTKWLFYWSWILALKLGLLLVFGQFSGLLSYFSIPDLYRVFYSTVSASGLLLVLWMRYGTLFSPPRGVILIDFILSLLGICAMRLGFRLVRERVLTSRERLPEAGGRRVAILGAGDVGASLARELLSKRGLGLVPVMFFDDNPAKWHSRIYDIPVVGSPELISNSPEKYGIQEAVIAMPSISAKRMGELVKILQKAKLKFETVPSLRQLATGKVKVSQLRSVEIQDLLGREPVNLETQNIMETLHGKVVMVTGAGGSIGSELCRQIATFSPDRLLLVEQSEVQLFQIEQELIEQGFRTIILPLIADILDMARMRYIYERFHPQIVFHAAAHKHVPMMESQPSEAIKNNSLGTALIADLALEYQVDRFVMISTDKAINPTNVMGATKRLAEIYLQSLYAANPNRTKFVAVRFGNVLGSSGSVIPIFQKQIAAGGPVKVTHKDMTRYFMTIPEAVGLVLQSSVQVSGGEIFVLDMGKPVKIVDLARQLIELSGFVPDEDIEIEFTGLRPGEKMFEEINYHKEKLSPTTHPKIMGFASEPQNFAQLKEYLHDLSAELHGAEANVLKMKLKVAVPEYKPFLTN